MSTDAPKLSPVEGFKDESRYLRGTIPDELQADTDHFGKGDLQLLKFHGTYQQDDRDSRKSPGGKTYSFMIRTRIPSGVLTSDQFLAHLDLCDEFGNSTMKLTTRQAIQLHGVPKTDLKTTIARINECGLSTLAACGDVNRNVMCCPAKRSDSIHDQIQSAAMDLAMHLAPRTISYRQCWLVDDETGEKQLLQDEKSPEEVEPIYGKTYLPRKFKIGIALPEDNCIDVYTQDLGMIAVVRDGKVIGYNFTVGGGMGTTPSAAKTFPALGKRMAFVKAEDVLKVAEAVVIVQRDNGNRADRKVARLKYLIAEWGIEKFRAAVEKHLGAPLDDCTEDDVHGFDDHIGWQDQGDGKWSYGLNVENGRLSDGPERQWKACFREICSELKPEIRLTSHQSAILCDIAPEDKPKLTEILKKHGIPVSEEVSTVRRWSMACVGLPTCGLSITESERALPQMIDELEAPLAKLGLDKDAFTIRMTGCPNGCARPYNADIGLVGKAKGKYTVFVGGALLGNRLNFIFRDLVPTEEVPSTLVSVFTAYKNYRQESETLGDFCARVGKDELEKLCSTPA
ncbi:NADPH-dependent assimilatory sulfite reductase hemoprotein subunit [Rosistilla oblonga]|uniref:Sulfite reductase [ferredoxin] n=1 Tax=Rosistilla oblonga TaxID=2527990 RepID=A0A518IYT1_9BACT|nr:NADPH-dependent assimilatory sulfite reductase hemoprotein subunit [Rosistilla oblonga]QDV58245.1 Sulfite reductase [ferredoxin] [Rosistilla oblonga]